MANKATWIKNINSLADVGPFRYLGLFQAGSTQTIERGDILEFTGNGNTAWVPIDSDFAMDSNIAIAWEEIKVGDLAGYYEVVVPRPGDIFEYALAAASAVAYGTALYYSAAQVVTTTTGSNIIGYAAGQEHYPLRQNHAADDAGTDRGSTIRSTSYVRMIITETASIYSLLQTG